MFPGTEVHNARNKKSLSSINKVCGSISIKETFSHISPVVNGLLLHLQFISNFEPSEVNYNQIISDRSPKSKDSL